MEMTSFGIELNQKQIDFIKVMFNLEHNHQVRTWMENQITTRLTKMIDHYYASNKKGRYENRNKK